MRHSDRASQQRSAKRLVLRLRRANRRPLITRCRIESSSRTLRILRFYRVESLRSATQLLTTAHTTICPFFIALTLVANEPIVGSSLGFTFPDTAQSPHCPPPIPDCSPDRYLFRRTIYGTRASASCPAYSPETGSRKFIRMELL
jgi:hypothetical protein